MANRPIPIVGKYLFIREGMSRKIVIGDKPLNEITLQDLRQLVVIEGCCAHTDYYSEPIVTAIDNKMFHNTVCLEYHSIKNEDNTKTATFTFYFDFQRFTRFYKREDMDDASDGKRLKIESIKFLIKAGYNLPL